MSIVSQLQIISTQNVGHTREKINRNGICREALVICKNSALTIRCEASKGLDTKTAEIKVDLIHDYAYDDEPERAVEFIHTLPLESRVHPISKTTFEVECRLKVLSSQLQSLFRLKISVTPKSSAAAIHCVSEPIKVISKITTSTKNAQAQRKTANEQIHEMIERLEQQNANNKRLLESLIYKEEVSVSGDSTPTSFDDYYLQLDGSLNSDQCSLTSSPLPPAQSDDISDSFFNFISSIKRLDKDERPRKIRRLLDSTPSSSVQDVVEFVGILNNIIPSSSSSSPLCNEFQCDQLDFNDICKYISSSSELCTM